VVKKQHVKLQSDVFQTSSSSVWRLMVKFSQLSDVYHSFQHIWFTNVLRECNVNTHV